VSGTLAVDNAARVESKPFPATQAIRMTEILINCITALTLCWFVVHQFASTNSSTEGAQFGELLPERGDKGC